MQRANIMLGLGGGRETTVPKYGVTAAEIAVLRVLHGEDSVFDVERVDDEEVSNGAEHQRLREIYGRATDGDGASVFAKVYPGAGARLFDKLAELGLPEEFYKAKARASASDKPKAALKGTRAAAGAATPDEDGISDLG